MALQAFQTGFRLVTGQALNLMVNAINTLAAQAAGTVAGIYSGVFNGTLGATTPASVAATTVDASGAVNLAGANVALSSLATGLTAHSGGTQGAALALTAFANIVTTVAAGNDSVALPTPTVVGQLCFVSNQAAANSMQVYAAGTGTINGVASATGVAVASKKSALYVATTTGAAALWVQLLGA